MIWASVWKFYFVVYNKNIEEKLAIKFFNKIKFEIF